MSDDETTFAEMTEVTIERLVPGGDGFARIDGRVTLVPGTLPGDRVLVRTEAAGARLLRGSVVKVLEAGADRREEDEICPRARDHSCGGCDWPAVKLEAHRRLKTEIVVDALRRIGRIPPAEIPEFSWQGSPRNYRLRNRLHLDRRGRLGFFGPRSNVVSDLLDCEIVSEALLARLPAIRGAFRHAGALEGELVTLESRSGKLILGEFRPAQEVADPPALAERLQGALDGIRILSPSGVETARLGATSLQISAGGVPFRVSVSSFFQGNSHLLDAFLGEAREAVRLSLASNSAGSPGEALDLYAGGGFLTRPLLEAGFESHAVEVDPSASADLEANFETWRPEGLGRSIRFHGTAESFLAKTRKPFSIVVADPPRAGLSAFVTKRLLQLRPRHLLLVSCDPATLARDLGALWIGFRIERATILDLFPGTHHVETMLLLSARAA